MAQRTNFNDFLLEQLKEPKVAAEFLMAAMEENDPDYLAEAMSKVVRARGVANVSKTTHLSRQALYKMFSPQGNPTLLSINAVLNAVGLKLSVAPIKKKSA